MQPSVLLPLLILVVVANGAPVAAKRLLGRRFAAPLDGGMRFVDRRPLLGGSKTVRGLAAAVLASAAAAPLVGFDWTLGLAVGAAAMAGDLLSSFVKRRLGLPSSATATGLDQIPESLLPLLVVGGPLALSGWDVALGVTAFLAGDLMLSPLLRRLGMRDRHH
ncbi:MAG: CDP-archaeol synthase [Rhodospirillales bacterium]